MLQVAGHLFIIPTYHNKQWQPRLDRCADHQRKNWRGKRQKSQVGKGRIIRKERIGQERRGGRRLTAVIMCKSAEEDWDGTSSR